MTGTIVIRLANSAAGGRLRKRTYNVRLVKRTWPYSVQEVADLFGVHKNAVLRWLSEGLHADQSSRPFLIRGSELARFLTDRQYRKRRRCTETEFFCFRCRAPREAYLGIADIAVESPTRLRVMALCGECGTKVSKVQRGAELAAIERRFHVQELTGKHLLVRPEPSLNSDLET
jgi:hypothetical protein